SADGMRKLKVNSTTRRSLTTATLAIAPEVHPPPNKSTFPGSLFVLHQSFEPAGDQAQAIDKLSEGIDDGLSYQTLLGVTGSGKTYTMANVIARIGRPAIIMAPNKTLAAQLYSEMRELF